jgi:hypothetical protein
MIAYVTNGCVPVIATIFAARNCGVSSSCFARCGAVPRPRGIPACLFGMTGAILRTTMTIWSQRNMKALARDLSICHPGEGRGPERFSWIPASAGMTNPRIPRRDFQVKREVALRAILLIPPPSRRGRPMCLPWADTGGCLKTWE